MIVFAGPAAVATIATAVAWPRLHRLGYRAMLAALLAIVANLPGVALVAEHARLQPVLTNTGVRRALIEDSPFMLLGVLGWIMWPLLSVPIRALVEHRPPPLGLVLALSKAAWVTTSFHTLICAAMV
jgi:hypothetical protein